MLASGFTSGGGVDGPAAFQFSVEFEDTERQVALLEVFEEDVSEGEGFPPRALSCRSSSVSTSEAESGRCVGPPVRRYQE